MEQRADGLRRGRADACTGRCHRRHTSTLPASRGGSAPPRAAEQLAEKVPVEQGNDSAARSQGLGLLALEREQTCASGRRARATRPLLARC